MYNTLPNFFHSDSFWSPPPFENDCIRRCPGARVASPDQKLRSSHIQSGQLDTSLDNVTATGQQTPLPGRTLSSVVWCRSSATRRVADPGSVAYRLGWAGHGRTQASHTGSVTHNNPTRTVLATTFYDQFWTICMYFGKSATNFGIAAAESRRTGHRSADSPKLPALFPKCMHCRLNWPEKVYFLVPTFRRGSRIFARGGCQEIDDLICDGDERFLTYANTDLQLFKMFIAILCLNGVE